MNKEKLLLIKGDVTAIQRYIFSVKNKDAAQIIKLHSQHIDKTTNEISEKLKDELKGSTLISEGGYFLLKVPMPPNLNEIWPELRKTYEKKERIGKLNLVLSYIKVPDEKELESNFAYYRGLLEEQAGRDKLQQGRSISGFFDPYPSHLPQNKKLKDQTPKDIPIWENCNEKLVDNNVVKKGIITFDSLASFAKQRTGSDLLASLKIDIDDLGNCFKNLKTKEAADKLSNKLTDFFGNELKNIRRNEKFQFNEIEYEFKDNIYLVFAGGDDSFLLGGYDAVLEFAKFIHAKFRKFAKKTLKEKDLQLKKEITCSASIILFKPTFPLLKLATKAEEDLARAKNASKNKNRISVLGEIFTWNEFYHLLKITAKLVDLIKKGKESKALISRIRDSSKGFAAALQHSHKGRMDIPRVWRLYYYLRNVKRGNKKEIEELIKEYEELILNAFMNKEKGNPMIFPVAARLAEYELKNYKS